MLAFTHKAKHCTDVHATFWQKNEKERELEPWEKARIKLKEMCTAEPHERDLNELSQVTLRSLALVRFTSTGNVIVACRDCYSSLIKVKTRISKRWFIGASPC